MNSCADSWNVDKSNSCEYAEFVEIPIIPTHIIRIITFNIIVSFDYVLLNLL